MKPIAQIQNQQQWQKTNTQNTTTSNTPEPPPKRICIHIAGQMISTEIKQEILDALETTVNQPLEARIHKTDSGNLDIRIKKTVPTNEYEVELIDQPIKLNTFQIKNLGQVFKNALEQAQCAQDLQEVLHTNEFKNLTSDEYLVLSKFFSTNSQATKAILPIVDMDNFSRLRAFAGFANNQALLDATHIYAITQIVDKTSYTNSCHVLKGIFQQLILHPAITPKELEALSLFAFSVFPAYRADNYQLTRELSGPNAINILENEFIGRSNHIRFQKNTIFEATFIAALELNNSLALHMLDLIPKAGDAIAIYLDKQESFNKCLDQVTTTSNTMFDQFISIAEKNIGSLTQDYASTYIPKNTTHQIPIQTLKKLLDLAPQLKTNALFIEKLAQKALATKSIAYLTSLAFLPLELSAKKISHLVISKNHVSFIEALKELKISPTKNDAFKAAKNLSDPRMIYTIFEKFPDKSWLDMLLKPTRNMTNQYKVNLDYILNHCDDLKLKIKSQHLTTAIEKKLKVNSLHQIIKKLNTQDITKDQVSKAIEILTEPRYKEVIKQLRAIICHSLDNLQIENDQYAHLVPQITQSETDPIRDFLVPHA